MNTKFLMTSIFTVLLAVIAFSGTKVSAQTDQIVGGYGDISVNSKDARRAAETAISSRSNRTGKKITLIRIKKAEQQVVAGLNNRVCMSVREGRHKPYTVTAVVYQDLKKKRVLSKWKRGTCSDI